jgi:hypothetical protein
MAMWNKSLLTLTLNTQVKAVEDILAIANRRGCLCIDHYVRIPDPGLTNVQRRRITLDRADRKTLVEIEDVAIGQAHAWKSRDEIRRFFSEKHSGWNFQR